MLKVTTTQIGKPLKTIIIHEENRIRQLSESIIDLGKRTHQFMIDFIKENTNTQKTIRQNDAKPLIEVIDFKYFQNVSGFGWGIGSIDKLNAESKQWAIINYGGKHPQAGKVVPGFFENTDVFLYAPNSGSFITIGIDTVIEPMDYIQATRNFLDVELKIILDKFNRG